MQILKYHPSSFEEFINYVKALGHDYTTLGSAVLVQSPHPVGDGWEYPTADDVFCFSVCISF